MKLLRTPGPHPALIFIAPALALILLLLFFLLLSTSFLLQPGIAVSVPNSPFLLSPQREPQVISITAAPTSSVYFDNSQVSFDDLRQKLSAKRGNKTLIIKADRQAPFEQLAKVLSIALELGYPTVIATAEEP